MKIRMPLCVALGFMAGSVGAEDLAAKLEQLQVKLEHTAQRVNQPSAGSSNVMGVRGAKQEPLSRQLYWKGKTTSAPVTPEEVKVFRTAIEEARVEKKAQAIATLKSFLEKYPKSGLRGDAEDTLKLLEAAPAPPAKP
jgi:TolA-binding protein